MQPEAKGFRDGRLAEKIARKIAALSKQAGLVRIMHVCGTHEDSISKAGIRSLLPKNIEVISGPGCPVCVTTTREIDEAISLALQDVTVTSFGDMLKVPGSSSSLAEQKTEGRDVRVVYSISDSVKIAEENPRREVVHVGIGFETTAPSTALAIKDAPENFSVLSCHRTIPPAMDFLLSTGETRIDGFIDPGHVSVVIGLEPYKKISDTYGIPQVVAGFEPIDVLYAILLLLKMIKEKDLGVCNEYSRVVKDNGNPLALAAMDEAFEECDVKWRGFPVIPKSGLKIREKYKDRDARKRFHLKVKETGEPRGCRCGEVLKGLAYPRECPLFGKRCMPEDPVGPCMVSGEGSCSIAYRYPENA